MKNLILTVFVVIAAIFSLNAQTMFGAKAGLNLATITGDETEDFNGRTSFHIGVLAEFEVSDTFSFQPELMYSSQGAEESYTEDGSKIEGDIKLDYLNIPLMAKFYVAEGFSIEAGPQIGILLSAEYDWKADGESGSIDLKDEELVKDIDFGLNFGLGYKLDGGLNFGARYNLGLSNVNDDVDSDDVNIKNGVFQVSVGYFF